VNARQSTVDDEPSTVSDFHATTRDSHASMIRANAMCAEPRGLDLSMPGKSATFHDDVPIGIEGRQRLDLIPPIPLTEILDAVVVNAEAADVGQVQIAMAV
jgi:hypothetical protein